MISYKFILGLALINLTLSLLLYKELGSIPSISTTLSILCNCKLNFFNAFLLLLFLIIIVPSIAIVLILGNFKRYIFTSLKSVTLSYLSLSVLYMINFLFIIGLTLVNLLIIITSNEKKYLLIRIPELYKDKYMPFTYILNLITMLIINSIMFIITTFCCELIITYKFYNTVQTFYCFLKKNIVFSILICAIVCLLFGVYNIFVFNFLVFSNFKYNSYKTIFYELTFSFFTNIFLQYLYFLFITN